MYIVVLVLMLSLCPMTAMAKSIVVLGDSISAGYGIDVRQGWVAVMQKKLNDQFPGYLISNQSISGETSAGGLARLGQILSRQKPDWVLVELGANDGLRGLSVDELKNNLTEIVRRSEKSGAKVLLLAMKIPPNYGSRYIEMFYAVYPQLSKELHVPYVPFILEDVALNPKMMQADGLHPKAEAQALIAEKIASYFLPLLE